MENEESIVIWRISYKVLITVQFSDIICV